MCRKPFVQNGLRMDAGTQHIYSLEYEPSPIGGYAIPNARQLIQAPLNDRSPYE
jgi:hypothetical protein